MKNSLNRRDILKLIGLAGGAAFTYPFMSYEKNVKTNSAKDIKPL